jgi:hypothetical protein
MAALLATLAAAGYNEQDILEGSADLHEVVKIYKDIFVIIIIWLFLFYIIYFILII